MYSVLMIILGLEFKAGLKSERLAIIIINLSLYFMYELTLASVF